VIVNEQTLLDFGICPIYVRPDEGLLEKTANELLKYAVIRVFKGIHEVPTLQFLREQYVSIWNSHWFGDKPVVIPSSGPYWQGPKRAPTVSRKIFDLITHYEILHPEQPYELVLNGYTIQGRYALVRKTTESGHPTVLVVHNKEPRHKASPDLLSLARFVHVKMTHLQYHEVDILHFPLLRSKPWRQINIDEKLATNWIKNAIFAIANNRTFPTAGPHCATCTTKPCMKVFDDRR
jgi:hypothetical protein